MAPKKDTKGTVKKIKQNNTATNTFTLSNKAQKLAPKRISQDAHAEKMCAAINHEIETFVNGITTLGVEGLRKQYQELQNYKRDPYKLDSFTANGRLNRDTTVVCLEETRVKLTVDQPGDSDYIHANWVKLNEHDRNYIATQAPLENTIPDFWRMAWQHNVESIVMLCKTFEDGKAVCVQYWPPEQGQFKKYGKMLINNLKVEVVDQCTVHTIEMLPEGFTSSKIVKLLQFWAWPDHGTPHSGKNVLRLIRLVALKHRLAHSNIVIHCLTGVGRTGAVILIDWILMRLFRGMPVDFVQLFKTLRDQRASCIQSEAEYLFIFATVLDYVKVRIPDKYTTIRDHFRADVKMLNLVQ